MAVIFNEVDEVSVGKREPCDGHSAMAPSTVLALLLEFLDEGDRRGGLHVKRGGECLGCRVVQRHAKFAVVINDLIGLVQTWGLCKLDCHGGRDGSGCGSRRSDGGQSGGRL